MSEKKQNAVAAYSPTAEEIVTVATKKISLPAKILGDQELTKETIQTRVKSPIFWSALIAQILTILVFTGVVDLNVSDLINNAVCGVLEVFVALGILNNPTNGAGL